MFCIQTVFDAARMWRRWSVPRCRGCAQKPTIRLRPPPSGSGFSGSLGSPESSGSTGYSCAITGADLSGVESSTPMLSMPELPQASGERLHVSSSVAYAFRQACIHSVSNDAATTHLPTHDVYVYRTDKVRNASSAGRMSSNHHELSHSGIVPRNGIEDSVHGDSGSDVWNAPRSASRHAVTGAYVSDPALTAAKS